MPSFVYVLGCRAPDRTLTYVGWTSDVDRRLAQHNAGTGARSTRGRAWILLHSESYETRNEAMSREWHLKRDRAFRKRLAVRAAERGGALTVDVTVSSYSSYVAFLEGYARALLGVETRLDKASRALKPGDEVVFALGGRLIAVRVEAMGERRGPAAEARTLYSPLQES